MVPLCFYGYIIRRKLQFCFYYVAKQMAFFPAFSGGMFRFFSFSCCSILAGEKWTDFRRFFAAVIYEYAGFILERNGEVPVICVTVFFLNTKKAPGSCRRRNLCTQREAPNAGTRTAIPLSVQHKQRPKGVPAHRRGLCA